MILDHLVLKNAHAGLGDRHAGQRNARIGRGERRAAEDPVDLFLRELCVFGLRFLDARHQCVEFLRVAYGFLQHFQLLTSH